MAYNYVLQNVILDFLLILYTINIDFVFCFVPKFLYEH